MKLKVGIKKVTTRKSDEGIVANAVLEFIFTPETEAALFELIHMHGESVMITADKMQMVLIQKEDKKI